MSEKTIKQHDNDEIPVDRLVKVFVKMRAALGELTREYEREKARRKDQMRVVENELLRRANVTGTEGFTTKFGTTYKGLDVHASIADDELFFAFVKEEMDLDFFTRRINLKHLKEYADQNEGEYPPGLNVIKENRMKIRAARKGRTPVNEEVEEDDET